MDDSIEYAVFSRTRRLAVGSLRDVLRAAKQHLDAHDRAPLLFFNSAGRQVEFDLAGPLEEMLDREAPLPERARPGRPKLGVISREVSLLPRHWEWLEQQPSGASAALRRLVDEARKRDPEGERARLSIEAAGRFLWSLAGNLPGFEEASRALFARDLLRFREHTKAWPDDVRKHAEELAQPGFTTD